MKYVVLKILLISLIFQTGCDDYTGNSNTIDYSGSISMENTVVVVKQNLQFYDDKDNNDSYTNNMDQTLTLIPDDSNKKVSINFTAFATDSSDYLTIYDGDSQNGNIIGSYSGSSIPATITSTATNGALTLRFTSDSAFTGAGWVATITTVQSISTLNMRSASVVVDSPISFYDNGGNTAEYKKNTDQTLTLIPDDSNKKVSINFTAFATDSSDYLTIYDGDSQNGNIIGSYSGSSIPATITSTATNGALTLRFTSDSAFTGAGWVATITTVQSISTLNMRSASVVVDSPISFYDNGGNTAEYKKNTDQTLTLIPDDSNKKVSINFTAFATDSSDYLTIYDGDSQNGNIIGSYSGSSIPATITSTATNGALTLRFTSDTSMELAGWVASITLVNQVEVLTMREATVVIENNTTFYSSNGTGQDYSNNEDKTLVIQPADSSKKVSIDFINFSTEPSMDTLTIHNGINTNGAVINSSSGSAQIGTVVSTATNGALTLKFTTDSSITSSGWLAYIYIQ